MLLKAKHMKWILLIVMMAVAFCALYWVQSQNKPAARTNLELDIDNIEKIEKIELLLRLPDGTQSHTPLEVSPWVDFLNSLKLTYHKDGWVTYSRPGTHLMIYYIDGTTDTIWFHFGHVIYNGDFYDIDNREGKLEEYDALLSPK